MQSFFTLHIIRPETGTHPHTVEALVARDYQDICEHIASSVGREGVFVGGDPRNVEVAFSAPELGLSDNVTPEALREYARWEFYNREEWPLWLIDYAPADIRAAVGRDQDRDYLAEETLEDE